MKFFEISYFLMKKYNYLKLLFYQYNSNFQFNEKSILITRSERYLKS